VNTNLITVFGFALVVLFAFVLPIVIYGIRIGHKQTMAELMADSDHVAELAEVKERLAVIERIVTDGSYDLDKEIRRLESA
jgi:Na+-transporting methylmalonyl-CoA/oxaloacetate decarboxylase gamma subunit